MISANMNVCLAGWYITDFLSMCQGPQILGSSGNRGISETPSAIGENETIFIITLKR